MALGEYSGRCAPISDLVNVGTKRQPRRALGRCTGRRPRS
jgi:hypothetical protein